MKTMLILIVLMLCSSLTANNKTVEKVSFTFVPKFEVKTPKNQFLLYDSGMSKGFADVAYIDQQKVVEKYLNHIQILIDSAKDDGIKLKLNSGFRTFGDQIRIRRKYVKDKSKKEDIDFLINAESTEFLPETGKPGHSRHQSGIAYDFSVKRDKKAYHWMVKNAFKHGFVRTLSNEKWHWEYLPKTPDPYFYVCQDHWSWK
jgi:LAS superfamily LD-carboxypeptidase LdcB